MYRENLKKLRKELNLSAQKLADKIGSTQVSVSNYETGKYKPSYEFLEALYKQLNVNLNWFVSGAGEMFNATQSEPPADIQKLVSDLIDAKLKARGLY
jgi:transcriptional regulator with XRE-family HTH domain